MAAMAKAFAKDSISGSTATTPPSRSGPGSLPSTEYEDVSSFSALSARAPEDRTEPMTGNFRRRRYYIPEEHSDSFKATVASPIRDSTTRCERRPREHIMQVKIEGFRVKRWKCTVGGAALVAALMKHLKLAFASLDDSEFSSKTKSLLFVASL
mmetsp:Transcript_4563/g.5172  ORF Transcript_4563/g.5172 Transcript_4563/m.5172 type:complete len:154 (+) Transcript_4563:46-507(+)